MPNAMKRIVTLAWISCVLANANAGIVTVMHPDEKFDAGHTAVWSPLFQATWDAMNRALGGAPQKVDPPNEAMAMLDAFKWDAALVMPESGWKVWSGEATGDFLKRVNAEAAEMTGDKEGPFTLQTTDPHVLACFGLLDREVVFEKEFQRAKASPLEFKAMDQSHKVSFFGTRGRNAGLYGRSVRVLHHAKDWHALEASCKDGDNKVILYLPPQPQNFAEACVIIRESRKAEEVKGGKFLNEGDDLRIPYLKLDVREDMAGRLQGGRFYGNAGDPWTIARAEQMTSFELFEKGARVRVETSFGAEPFGSPPPPPPPRNFLYDRPFFVFLWRDGAEWPYFGAWIGDASALRKFE